VPSFYVPIVRGFGLDPTRRYPWAIIGRTQRVQGWKLHLSSVQSEAPALLDAVLPILREERVAFKLAQDDRVLALLNEGELGATQIGKFLTIYPESDELARRLALQLIDRTREFSGPEIITDLRLGAVVYARHGGFRPVIRRERLGYAIPLIEAPDGQLVPDRYTVPFAPPAHVTNPFAELGRYPQKRGGHERQQSRKLIGPGYLIVQPLKTKPYGGALLAIDLRSQETVALKVLKFGRAYCLSDEQGRDIRDRLKRQGILHAELSRYLPVPDADPYFEVDGHGYLALEYVEGRDFEHLLGGRLAHRPWHELPARVRRRLLEWAAELTGIVRRLHAAGYVHRDLSPSNVWIAKGGRIRLLDLELAHRVDDTTPAFRLGTAGFMSPQQIAREAPAVTDDVYSIGCLMAFLLTRLDPRRFVFPSDRYLQRRLERLVKGAPSRLIDIMRACLHEDADLRPDLVAVETTLIEAAGLKFLSSGSECISAPPFGLPSSRTASLPDRIDEVLRRGQRSLISQANDRGGLWLSARSAAHRDRGVGVYEVERHANRGVAGVVYLLARLARYGHRDAGAERIVQRAVSWLLETAPPEGEGLPGLHFGEAGVAVALPRRLPRTTSHGIRRSTHLSATAWQAPSTGRT
jgi:class IV lanthipeptide synthase